ncbi:MAG: MerR family transcriptional regulator [Candidatus Taylorbacteria bacterium]|nr:MerR family transcriptional regulator [Candidatus Taylorbacteria bacterium]
MTDKKLLSVKEAASMLGVTPLTLRNWDKSGKLKAMRHPMNNYRVYRKESIDKLIESMSDGSAPVYVPKKKKVRKLEVKHE